MKINTMPEKITSVASYCTSGGLFCGGAMLQGLENINWSTVAVIGGLVLGVATYITNLWMQIKQDRRAEALQNLQMKAITDIDKKA